MPSKLPLEPGKPSGKTEKLYVAAGCFWCIEGQMDMLKGVTTAVSGYAGGRTKNPTYKDVMSGTTGHAEVVEVTFDPGVIKAEDILRIFFVSHDPTQLNRQGPDVGTQYRSATFYRNDEEKALLEKIKAEMIAEKLFPGKIVTTIEPLGAFTRAEEYHQNYFAKFEKASESEKAQMNAGYCSYVVSPKIIKFREQFAHLLKN
ncbi:MAG: peptide-methionine (S)-S-oxide reductase MsrA [Chthonomonas sp.]|nr:peptide-methionine (S)-S-oxide reductase MsrA [Chthonomonas sp.]